MNTEIDRSRISLDLLQLFIAVVEHGNISAAARVWEISPSLANRRMATLESELNAHLFERSNRSIHLTDAGYLALEWAKKVAAEHSQLTEELASLKNNVSGGLRIISNEYLLTLVLPDFLAKFSLKFPDINFNLTMTDSVVSNDRRDYDVMIFSGQVPDTALKGTRVRDFERVVCASPDFLERYGTPIGIEELADYDCLVHQQAVNNCWVFKKDGVLIKQKIKVKALSTSHLPLIHLAINGMGIIQISKGSVKSELHSGALVTLFSDYECVNDDGSHPSTWVIFPGKQNLIRTQVFVSELKAYLRELSR